MAGVEEERRVVRPQHVHKLAHVPVHIGAFGVLHQKRLEAGRLQRLFHCACIVHRVLQLTDLVVVVADDQGNTLALFLR